MMYLIDANILITAKNSYYRFDTCPGFWDIISAKNLSGEIGIIDMVANEIKTGGDDLKKWLINKRLIITPNSTDEIQTIYQNMTEDIVKSRVSIYYKKSETERFLDGADPWLIATAKAYNYTVVTGEVLVSPNSSRPKIPNVCRHYQVECINSHDMLERLNARFILET